MSKQQRPSALLDYTHMLSDEVIAYSKAFGEMRVERDEWKKKYENIYRQANHIAKGNDISEIVEPVRYEWGNGIAVLGKEEIRKIANTEAHRIFGHRYGYHQCPVKECGKVTDPKWHDQTHRLCPRCTTETQMAFVYEEPPE